MLSLLPLPEIYFQQVYEWEPGDCEYDDWLSRVTRPEYLNYGIFRDDAFVGYLGLEKSVPDTVEIHFSAARKALHPIESRRLVIQTGIYLFQTGTRFLSTVHRTTNRPACRLAKACGMALETIVIRGAAPHCNHTLCCDAYFANPQLWEI